MKTRLFAAAGLTLLALSSGCALLESEKKGDDPKVVSPVLDKKGTPAKGDPVGKAAWPKPDEITEANARDKADSMGRTLNREREDMAKASASVARGGDSPR